MPYSRMDERFVVYMCFVAAVVRSKVLLCICTEIECVTTAQMHAVDVRRGIFFSKP